MVVTSNTDLGSSVVPDLMRVYESLTQSKTPQIAKIDVQSNLISNTTTIALQQQSTALHLSEVNNEPLQNYPISTLPNQVPVYQVSQQISSQCAPAQSQEITLTKKVRPRRSSSLKRSIDSDQINLNVTKPRKKKNGDGRWSKRFAWPDELHRDFVSAVFDVGLKSSSPSSILEHMIPHEHITTERINSHLQKYRIHRQKSKKDESSLLKMKSVGTDSSDPQCLNSGEIAAHFAYSTIVDKDVAGVDPISLVKGGILQLPQLTEEEKRSPVGASLGYLMGLFSSLNANRGTQQNINGASAISPSNLPQPNVVHIQQPAHCSLLDGTKSHITLPLDAHKTNINVPTSNGQDRNIPSSINSALDVSLASSGQQPFYQKHSQILPTQVSQNKLGITTPVPSQTSVLPPPDERNNNPMEESNMMKRDMQSQMEFQNKMRKLKEQELSKYTQSTDACLELYTEISHDALSSVAARSEGVGLGIDADFWKSDQVLDEHLFEFLMND